MQELWLQHNQIAQLSLLAPLSALPSLTALFLSPNPLCADLKSDYRAAVVYTLTSLQVSCCCGVSWTCFATVASLQPCCILMCAGQVVHAVSVTCLAAVKTANTFILTCRSSAA